MRVSYLAAVLGTALAIGIAGSSCRESTSPGGGGWAPAASHGASLNGPRGRAWPNEPSGFVLLTDYGFEDSIPASDEGAALGLSGWKVGWNPVGNGSRIVDGAAPFSPPFVYEVKYPIGFLSGLAPSTLQYDLTPPAPELYWAFWWKPSDPFQSDGSGVNKIVFIWTQAFLNNSTDLLYFDLSPGPWRIRCMNDLIAGGGPSAGQRLEPNVTVTEVALGAWHLIEIYARYSTGARTNGVVTWWVDGVLNGHYTDLKMVPDTGFRYLQVAPTYGGNTGDLKLQTDYYWFDHVRVSRAHRKVPGGGLRAAAARQNAAGDP